MKGVIRGVFQTTALIACAPWLFVLGLSLSDKGGVFYALLSAVPIGILTARWGEIWRD